MGLPINEPAIRRYILMKSSTIGRMNLGGKFLK